MFFLVKRLATLSGSPVMKTLGDCCHKGNNQYLPEFIYLFTFFLDIAFGSLPA